MMQNKNEYVKVKEGKVRCGKYRYLTAVKRIIAFEKLINKNRADVKLSSFVHNFRRFTSEKYIKPTIHDEKYYTDKKIRLRKHAEFILLKHKIHIFTSLNISLTKEEEKELTTMLTSINPIHSATGPTTSANNTDGADSNNTQQTTAKRRE